MIYEIKYQETKLKYTELNSEYRDIKSQYNKAGSQTFFFMIHDCITDTDIQELSCTSRKETVVIPPKKLVESNNTLIKVTNSNEQDEESEIDLDGVDEVEPVVDGKLRKRKFKKRDTRSSAKKLKLLKMDEENNLILPFTIKKNGSEVTILNIGTIIHDRDSFHTPRFIWPANFHSQKLYHSFTNPDQKCIYDMFILDEGENPIFQIVVNDEGVEPRIFRATSASGVWKKALQELMERKIPNAKTTVSGPDFFGISDLGVINYIQELPDAKRLKKYIRQKWITENEEKVN
ncbi:transforming growth factor beta regulator 1 [Lobulomyces angularis]|nr:transforming growth factor beta regulator 1 [Lobulomyces angularis]